MGVHFMYSWCNYAEYAGKIGPTLFGYEVGIGDIIDSIMAFFTLISLILLWYSIVEMKRDRDAAYRPSLLMNPIEYTITWNDKGEEEWLSSSKPQKEGSVNILEDGKVHVSLEIPVILFREDGLETISIVNVGVGAAKNIVFRWNRNNIDSLQKQLLEIDSSRKDFCSVDKNITFTINKHIVAADMPKDYRLMYMLADAKQTYTIPIPTSYTILIHEIFKAAKEKEKDTIAHFTLEIEYTDVQGKRFSDTCFIFAKKVFSKDDLNNKNCVTYQLSS